MSNRETAAEHFEAAAEAVRAGDRDHAVVENVELARLAIREARMREREPEQVVRWKRGP